MSYQKIAHIVCIDDNGFIGYNNQLVWSIPEDMQYFRQTTKGHITIMGRKTFESIGSKPLPNRDCIVISKTLSKNTPNVTIVESIEESLEVAKELVKAEPKDIFIIGGSQIYKDSFKYINELHISVINKCFQTELRNQLGPNYDPRLCSFYPIDEFQKEHKKEKETLETKVLVKDKVISCHFKFK